MKVDAMRRPAGQFTAHTRRCSTLGRSKFFIFRGKGPQATFRLIGLKNERGQPKAAEIGGAVCAVAEW